MMSASASMTIPTQIMNATITTANRIGSSAQLGNHCSNEEERMRLEGKTAIVTGGGAGFGEGICRRFAAEGARVIVNDVNEQDGRHVADAIGEAGGEARFVYADVSRDDDTGRLVAEAVERYGRLDIMVNNAGVPQRAQPM